MILNLKTVSKIINFKTKLLKLEKKTSRLILQRIVIVRVA